MTMMTRKPLTKLSEKKKSAPLVWYKCLMMMMMAVMLMVMM